MAESKDKLKRLLRKVKEKSEKDGLKLNIQKTKIMPSNEDYYFMAKSWETMETVTNFIFRARKSLQMVTAVMKLKDACSLKQKL